ncbi:hypothetical protein GGI25_002606 [Coemansia spiralis]|uniref:Uncharacterized protein n=2 Tax=Coemansia TaxID=4863 RepID=A0A9W8G9R2_9FUNG|nr:ABC transporter transmembrane region 2-domain-containing protein [Coemansia spiralis]KAJ1992236.1 hypothetical protein EDC05_002904 [Coemansia umbellata]KAJ2623350.1 hypothetical protein GGI26_002388 [Coemansia sp. RSA 1358]KAJ2678102.1 hypothetical protein GGI25_002606 [Coemansia spiralis]
MPKAHQIQAIEMTSYQPLLEAGSRHAEAIANAANEQSFSALSQENNTHPSPAMPAAFVSVDAVESTTLYSPNSGGSNNRGWHDVADIVDEDDEKLADEDKLDQQTQKQYAIGLIFAQRLLRVFRVLLFAGQAPSNHVGLCCLLLVVGKLLAEVIYYYSGKQPSEFYKVLGDKDKAAFYPLLLRCFVVVSIAGTSKAALEYLSGRLGVMIRNSLTLYTHARYIAARKLYPLVSQGIIDNPDQRIAQDIERLSSTMADVLAELLIAPFLIAYYTVKCWSIAGFFGPLSIYLYFIIGALASRSVMPPIVRSVYKQEREEGNLRFNELHICSYAESIAFFSGEIRERETANQALLRVVRVQKQLLERQFWLALLTQIFAYLGSTVSYVIIAIPIFMGVYNDKSSSEMSSIISLNAFVSIYLIYRFSSVIEQAKKLADVAGYSARVVQLWEELDILDEDADETKHIYPGESGKIVLKDLTVKTPNGMPLVSDLNLEIVAGEPLMIVGANGTGKTSILRTICGLWQPSRGYVQLPYVCKAPSVFFLPQMPYIVAGSLREQVSYPGKWGNRLQVCSDREIAQLLRTVGLGHLIDEIEAQGSNSSNNSNAGGYDKRHSVQYWLKKLSPGEQQRISIARVLFWTPEFAILDECTSSLDKTAEDMLYQVMANAGITFVSVTHHSGLAKYHKQYLSLSHAHPYTLSSI